MQVNWYRVVLNCAIVVGMFALVIVGMCWSTDHPQDPYYVPLDPGVESR